LVPAGEKPKRMETDHPKAGSEPNNVRLCSLMFAYVRFIGKKLSKRRPVYFCGKTALPTAATVSSEFFKGRLARRGAGGRRATAKSRTTDIGIPLRSDHHLTITTPTMSSSRRRLRLRRWAGAEFPPLGELPGEEEGAAGRTRRLQKSKHSRTVCANCGGG
jgi:hypothetical protein